MKLERENVVSTLIAVLHEVQQDLGDDSAHIDENTQPIGGLSNFDSLTSVEVTVRCLGMLDFKEPPKFPSVFIDKNSQSLTVGEAANRIMKLK